MYRIFNQSEPSTLPVKLYISACYIELAPSFGCTPSQFCSSIETRNFRNFPLAFGGFSPTFAEELLSIVYR